jgi:hypothetical protein
MARESFKAIFDVDLEAIRDLVRDGRDDDTAIVSDKDLVMKISEKIRSTCTDDIRLSYLSSINQGDII